MFVKCIVSFYWYDTLYFYVTVVPLCVKCLTPVILFSVKDGCDDWIDDVSDELDCKYASIIISYYKLYIRKDANDSSRQGYKIQTSMET